MTDHERRGRAMSISERDRRATPRPARSKSRTTASGVTIGWTAGRLPADRPGDGTVAAHAASVPAAAVDIDRFIARNQPTWHRLDELSAGAPAAGCSGSSPPRSTSWSRLYQRVSSHLSHARVAYDDPGAHRPADPPGRASQRGHLRQPVARRCGRSATSSPGASPPRCGRAGASWPSARAAAADPGRRRGRLAGDRPTRRSTPSAPDARARGVPRGGLRVVLLVRARRAVRHRGHRQQHPGGRSPRSPRAPCCACPPRRRSSCQRRQPRRRRRACSPTRASCRSSSG